MAVLITCKSDEDPTKNKIAIICTTFSKAYGALKGMPVLVICKSDADLIKKNKVSYIRTTFLHIICL